MILESDDFRDSNDLEIVMILGDSNDIRDSDDLGR